MARLPKNTLLRIHRLHRDKRLGVAFVMYHCTRTLDDYDAMFRKAKRAFPDLRKCQCECGKAGAVKPASRYAVLQFHVTIPDIIPEGWELKDGPLGFELA